MYHILLLIFLSGTNHTFVLWEGERKLLGWLLGNAIYTQSSPTIILPHFDLAQMFVCLLGKREVQRLLGLVVERAIYPIPVR